MQTHDRMAEKDAGVCIAHDLTDLFLPLGRIAMHRAHGTECLCPHEWTARDALLRIGIERLALGAEAAFGRVMNSTTVERNHLVHDTGLAGTLALCLLIAPRHSASASSASASSAAVGIFAQKSQMWKTQTATRIALPHRMADMKMKPSPRRSVTVPKAFAFALTVMPFPSCSGFTCA